VVLFIFKDGGIDPTLPQHLAQTLNHIITHYSELACWDWFSMRWGYHLYYTVLQQGTQESTQTISNVKVDLESYISKNVSTSIIRVWCHEQCGLNLCLFQKKLWSQSLVCLSVERP
jgi:hypothetical protein